MLNTRKLVAGSSILAMLLISATSQAAKIEYDFGLGVSADNNHILGSSDLTYLLRGGVITNQKNRFLATYTYSGSSELSKYIVSYDYLHYVGAGKAFSLFTGLSGGYKYQDVAGISDKGTAVYGGQIGLNYRLTKQFSTELGYKLLSTSRQEVGSFNDEVYFSLDYHF
ncbi:TPA: outer membrane beta-barrel protein [Vibrio cholerae]|nr:outer membrane beta-barrel protein [Vibrio cholerae]